MKDCIFCKIAQKEIPSEIVYETDRVICFRDISPAAPTHVLIAPKKHIRNIMGLSVSDTTLDDGLQAAIFDAITQVAKICGVHDEGFRVISNCGTNGGQTVDHLHFHLLGGIKLNERLL
jgi:histidine triad (HIT) family protein